MQLKLLASSVPSLSLCSSVVWIENVSWFSSFLLLLLLKEKNKKEQLLSSFQPLKEESAEIGYSSSVPPFFLLLPLIHFSCQTKGKVQLRTNILFLVTNIYIQRTQLASSSSHLLPLFHCISFFFPETTTKSIEPSSVLPRCHYPLLAARKLFYGNLRKLNSCQHNRVLEGFSVKSNGESCDASTAGDVHYKEE